MTDEYFEQPSYRTYRAAVTQLLLLSPNLTTRGIHESLGYEFQCWTADVLEDPRFEQSWTLPVRYRLRERYVKEIRYRANERRKEQV